MQTEKKTKKKSVFNLVLNAARGSTLFICSGIESHNWGSKEEKAQPPYVLDLMAGMHNSINTARCPNV
jgi:hypothetical protein